VDFSFSELDISFRDGVATVLADRCPPAAVRKAWDAPTGGTDRAAWDALADLGVLDALIPEGAGGLGLDERSLVLVFEEAGRAALPDPLIETAAVAAPLIGPHGAGSRSVVASNLGAGPGRALVPWGADADLLLLEAADRTLHLLPTTAVAVEAVEAVDGSRRLVRVSWEQGPGSQVDADPELLTRARERGVMAAAAELIGLSERMLELTVAYVRERNQFGVPVGSFQAVKHHLADAAVAVEFARPLVYRSAWSLATGAAEAARDVSMAKAMASEAALTTARAALQCHGAIGYTTEHDLHLYMKRAWALARAWGDAAQHRDRVARSIGA